MVEWLIFISTQVKQEIMPLLWEPPSLEAWLQLQMPMVYQVVTLERTNSTMFILMGQKK